MSTAYEYVQALSRGEEPPAPFRIAWGLHEGMRGATWTIVASDGVVYTNTIKPTRGPFVPQKPTEIGRLTADEVRTFAAILCAQRFDLLTVPAPDPASIGLPEVELAVSLPEERFSLRCPTPALADIYGLDEIGRVFKELRARFVTP